MPVDDSQKEIIKALLIQVGGSSYVSRDALGKAMDCDLAVKSDENGITLTVSKRKVDKAPARKPPSPRR